MRRGKDPFSRLWLFSRTGKLANTGKQAIFSCMPDGLFGCFGIVQLLEAIQVSRLCDEDIYVEQLLVFQVLLAEPCLTHEEVGTVIQLLSDDFFVAFRVVTFNQ